MRAVRRSSSGLARSDAATSRQVVSEDREGTPDAPPALLVTADRVPVGDTHHFGHLLLREAEPEPNTLQLPPGQTRQATGRARAASTAATAGAAEAVDRSGGGVGGYCKRGKSSPGPERSRTPGQ